MEKYPFLLAKQHYTLSGTVSLTEKIDGENKLIGFPALVLLQTGINLVEYAERSG